ncbi:hypothetical protein KPMX200_250166 [Klebsiella pneumoniae]|nr:hypothetical protein KPMX200_250166 [Klebsiella pneumoniae]
MGEVKDDSEPDTLAPALARIPTISLRDFATIRALFMRSGVARRGDAHVWIDLCINNSRR